jgi:hypothetical protein
MNVLRLKLPTFQDRAHSGLFLIAKFEVQDVPRLALQKFADARQCREPDAAHLA